MKKSMYKKILIIALLMSIFLIIISSYSQCIALSDVTNDSAWEVWKPGVDATDTSVLTEKTGIILGFISTLGIVVSVCSLAFIGIKFMVGSVEEKAQYKQTIVPWLFGAIMVFAITTIPTLIYELTNPTFTVQENGSGTISNYYLKGYDDAMQYIYDKAGRPSEEKVESLKNLNNDEYVLGYKKAKNNTKGVQYLKKYANASLSIARNIESGKITRSNIKESYDREKARVVTGGEQGDERNGRLDRYLLQMEYWGLK